MTDLEKASKVLHALEKERDHLYELDIVPAANNLHGYAQTANMHSLVRLYNEMVSAS